MNPYNNYNYHNVARVREPNINRGNSVDDKKGHWIEFVTEVEIESGPDEGELEEVTHRLPAKFEICGQCEGSGKHVNPSVDCCGLSSDDFEQDPDFEQDYFAGVFDVTCYTCKGKRVVSVLDEKKCDPNLLQEYRDHLQEEYEYQAMCAAERRRGC